MGRSLIEQAGTFNEELTNKITINLVFEIEEVEKIVNLRANKLRWYRQQNSSSYFNLDE